ncbi:MAG: hypothetical protein AB7E46_14935 [Desulfovibrio sp.]
MTASINTSSAATAQPTRAGVDARPQVQSRRVSLTLGPLGITYSTDQVLWTEAVAAAGISASAASGIKGAEVKTPVTPAAALAPPGRDGAGQQDQQAQQAHEAQAAGRTFSLELAQAWRRQVEERVRPDQTYDRNGLARAKGRGDATAREIRGASSPAAVAAAGAASETAVETATSVSAEQRTRPPASRMRQAIGAYLACARSFNTVPPMLTAVA